ncbi:hypothetical protein Slin15195_G019030 [Septoria linicola]|uniref:Uncharacterized protein n=1 Tax=Septoria linicola TaxID=215465 RepID=A0A9Q9EG58_9PEZI|nr:hypothetical protein Slin14017_G019100 [Septoria linicola]USW48584.1 hypothetical protein Slin15195_G019030 [Septoria linicola]
MSSNLMDTEKGGEQTQYEGEHTDVLPTAKSTGQFGSSSQTTTEDPSATSEAAKERVERGEKTAENIRYGQTISEGGMSGFTTAQGGSAEQGGYGGVKDQSNESSAAADRKAQGYGGKEDHNKEIGA